MAHLYVTSYISSPKSMLVLSSLSMHAATDLQYSTTSSKYSTQSSRLFGLMRPSFCPYILYFNSRRFNSDAACLLDVGILVENCVACAQTKLNALLNIDLQYHLCLIFPLSFPPLIRTGIDHLRCFQSPN